LSGEQGKNRAGSAESWIDRDRFQPVGTALCWLLYSSAEVQAIFDAKFARLGRVLRRKTGTQGDTRQTKHTTGSRKLLPTPEMNSAINLKRAINKWLVACFVAEQTRERLAQVGGS
jgi:hypothetical protein